MHFQSFYKGRTEYILGLVWIVSSVKIQKHLGDSLLLTHWGGDHSTDATPSAAAVFSKLLACEKTYSLSLPFSQID